MPSLTALQQWLFAVATHPDSAAAGVAAQSRTLEEIVKTNAIASPLERVGIYHQSYFSRLEECLADDYPAVKYALGDAAFAQLCRDYATAWPSKGTNLNVFGVHLVEFLEERAMATSFVSELARLEWAIVDVLHSPSADSFSTSDLSSLPSDRLEAVRFAPSPSVRLLSCEYPVNQYFQDYLDDARPRLPAKTGSFVLVARQGYRIRRLELQPNQATVLRRLLSGEPLGASLSGIVSDEGVVASWFRDWTERGIFAGASTEHFTQEFQ